MGREEGTETEVETAVEVGEAKRAAESIVAAGETEIIQVSSVAPVGEGAEAVGAVPPPEAGKKTREVETVLVRSLLKMEMVAAMETVEGGVQMVETAGEVPTRIETKSTATVRNRMGMECKVPQGNPLLPRAAPVRYPQRIRCLGKAAALEGGTGRLVVEEATEGTTVSGEEVQEEEVVVVEIPMALVTVGRTVTDVAAAAGMFLQMIGEGEIHLLQAVK